MADSPRIPWPPVIPAMTMFDRLTLDALDAARGVTPNGDRYLPPELGELLELLADCRPTGDPAERTGATYKVLAFIGHRAGFDSAQRAALYALAERYGLTQRHAGHIIARLNDAEHMVQDLEDMLSNTPTDEKTNPW